MKLIRSGSKGVLVGTHVTRVGPLPSLAMLCFLGAISCSSSSPPQEARPATGEITVVYSAWTSRFERNIRELVSDSSRWRAVWDSTGAVYSPGSTIPQVDFSRYNILVAVGPPSGDGDSIGVDSVSLTSETINARVTAYRACSPVNVSQMPVYMVRVPGGRHLLKIVERELLGPDCPKL